MQNSSSEYKLDLYLRNAAMDLFYNSNLDGRDNEDKMPTALPEFWACILYRSTVDINLTLTFKMLRSDQVTEYGAKIAPCQRRLSGWKGAAAPGMGEP